MAYNTPGLINGTQYTTDGSWIRGQSSWNLGFLHTYPLTMLLGVICAFLSVAYFWKRQKYSWENLQILVILIIPGAIIGARLWFLIAEGGWSQWYYLSGLSIQGGVMGSVIFGTPFLWRRRHSMDMRTVYGIIVPSVILGQAIGRWGNFDNHEVFGRITSSSSLDWMGAMKSHMFIAIKGELEGQYRQPLFFYEFLTSIIGYIVLVPILLRKNWVRPGVTATLYLLYYGIVRASMEPLRDESDIMRWGSLPISLFIACLSITAGLILTIWFQFFDYKKYDLIQPIKERKLFLFGKVSDKKKKYLFWGEELDNKIRIWLPHDNSSEKWSKRKINSGVKK